MKLSAQKIEKIEKTYQTADPGDLMIDYLQLKVGELDELIKGYRNCPESIKSIARKRIALVAEELATALTAPR